jgi:sugar-specific transcriptional regulator TrmB
MNSYHPEHHSVVEEITEVIRGTESIVDETVTHFTALKRYQDICADSNAPSMFVIPDHPVTKAYQELKKRGIRLRFITEITKDNIESSKELMKKCDLRHLDEIKGNFGISDGIYYTASAKTHQSSPPPLLIVSTLRDLVEQQQYFFDMLWRKAIPAKQRIKELEHGLKREFVETIQDPYEAQTILNNILNSANEEILLTLPTKTTALGNKRLYRYEQEHLIPLLRNAVERGVKLRFLFDKSVDKGMDRDSLITNNDYDTVETQVLDLQEQNKIIAVIADKEVCLTVEVRDENDDDYDEYDSAIEVLGLATYSNSQSTVSSYASIFDTLWIQAELRSKAKKKI